MQDDEMIKDLKDHIVKSITNSNYVFDELSKIISVILDIKKPISIEKEIIKNKYHVKVGFYKRKNRNNIDMYILIDKDFAKKIGFNYLESVHFEIDKENNRKFILNKNFDKNKKNYYNYCKLRQFSNTNYYRIYMAWNKDIFYPSKDDFITKYVNYEIVNDSLIINLS
jgi:hypothetical protein